MTPEELAEIEERCRKATAGPWVCIYRGHDELDGQKYAHDETPLLVMSPDCESHPVADASCNHTCRMPEDTEANARFIAHARADVPALLADNRRLREAWAGERRVYRADAEANAARAEKAEAEVARLRRTSLPHMCRDGHEEIRHAGDDELCPVCRAKSEAERARGDCDAAVHAAQANTAELARAWKERDAALAQTYRLREALDAAQRIVRRKADREAGREET